MGKLSIENEIIKISDYVDRPVFIVENFKLSFGPVEEEICVL